MSTNSKNERFNRLLNSMPIEYLQSKSRENLEKDHQDFQILKDHLLRGDCVYCGTPISLFSKDNPCFHWLLNPKGFKKKFFPLVFEGKGFHQIEAYLRWVANCDKPMQNINDLVEEKSSTKFIEETIRYKNIEWSFSCSYGDLEGHANTHEGKEPHYHFQMKVNGNVIINYNGFHIPFNEYDDFCFAVKRGDFERLRDAPFIGAGMQALLDNTTPGELIDKMESVSDIDSAQFHINIMIEADEGSLISGDEIADLIEEKKRTGVPLAKLVQKLKNVKIRTIISPGPGVPEIAPRSKNR